MGLAIKFYCRKCKSGKDGLSSVEVSVIVDGKRCIISLPRKERPEEFNKNKNSKRDNDTKRFIEASRRNILEYITALTERREKITAEKLRKCIRDCGIDKFTLREVYDEFISIQQKRVGVCCGQGQIRKYELAFERLSANVDPSRTLESISRADIEGHIAELMKRYKPASVASDCTRLRAIFKYGFDCGYSNHNPFAQISKIITKPREEWLNDDELQRIRDLKGLNKDLETARDMFLFQCATGMSYSDMMRLQPDEVKSNNGVYSVVKTRTKTGVRYSCVVLPEGVEILKKWNFQVPRKSNPKYNLCLLKIEYMTGINKHLHSHLGRKVYGTTLLRGGVSMKAVSKALGHSTSQITESTYAFLQSEDVIKEIASKMVN